MLKPFRQIMLIISYSLQGFKFLFRALLFLRNLYNICNRANQILMAASRPERCGTMLSDIEIAQGTTLRPIAEIAEELGIREDELELYGKYKAKINEQAFARLADKPDGKLVLVTAINPTPAGEGKTTTTAGLGQAMAKSERKPLSLCGNLLWGLCSVSRAERRSMAMPRFFPWKISTSILPEICTLSLPPTICAALCWITICSKGILWELTPDGFRSNAALI